VIIQAVLAARWRPVNGYEQQRATPAHPRVHRNRGQALMISLREAEADQRLANLLYGTTCHVCRTDSQTSILVTGWISHGVARQRVTPSVCW
jgi:hypothetical protein